MAYPTKKFPGQQEWDSVDSTYRWEIILTNGKVLIGYSKNKNFPEMKDKIELFQTTVFRLYRSNYFDASRVRKIEYYTNSPLQTRQLIATLAPHGYIFGNLEDFLFNKRLVGFFDRFYTMMKAGNVITVDVIDKLPNTPEEKIFSLAEKRFVNEHKLLLWSFDKVREGYPIGRIKNFVIQYRNKYLLNSAGTA